ncbi:hypothetical protein BUALT_Bualt06G0036600 [Buddleja alternifolia]|uniref:Uncharacterized protein n=1 Tax=Buddleja alternifolia TaxID=168488 RepID=A0AAV6XDZ6_9LAMI|nr:hypothetical protein BUALT_Bualt06G0036600 [Buddleja alternifolia]
MMRENPLATLKEEGPDDVQQEDEVPPLIKKVLEENQDVMPPQLPTKLPHRQEVDHIIKLESGVKSPSMTPYRMSPPELEELRKQLKDLLDKGMIRPLKAPFGTPVLFQRKHDGSLRMCVDYRALNKVTVKNKYTIPLIADLFDRLGNAKIYTKMDLEKGYYQVRIVKGDELKTACITRYGSFEWLVMPFGLTHAPAIFCTLINKIFHPYLDRFVVVYLDDIVVYSNSIEEHVDHLRTLFQVLRENELYVKKEKCSFAKEGVLFLGHIIRHAPLTDLLKKNKPGVWSEVCQLAFKDLKAAVSEEPVLALPNFEKMFELHTNASDFAIGGDMASLLVRVSVRGKNRQRYHKLFPNAEETLPEASTMADALSRKPDLAVISLAKGNVHEKIKEGLEHDPMAKELMKLAKEGKTRQFWVEDGLLYTKGRRLYVPKWGNLRRDLIRECHDTKWAGHPGQKRTMALLEAAYFWPEMKDGVEEAARAFFKNVVKYWGLPKSIITDRDSRFTGRLWTELFKLLGSELCFSTSFHPQTDGQTERVNALLECYLRHFVSANQHDWAKLLDVAQFSYNLQMSEATGKSPFELATGKQPLTPHTLAISFESAKCPLAEKMAKSWAEQSDLAKSFLEKARRKMKKWADPKRRYLINTLATKC